MIWISIILGIIQAIPSLIKLIEEIVALIHGHPLQAMHEHAFFGILHAWHDKRDGLQLQNDLAALRMRL